MDDVREGREGVQCLGVVFKFVVSISTCCVHCCLRSVSFGVPRTRNLGGAEEEPGEEGEQARNNACQGLRNLRVGQRLEREQNKRIKSVNQREERGTANKWYKRTTAASACFGALYFLVRRCGYRTTTSRSRDRLKRITLAHAVRLRWGPPEPPQLAALTTAEQPKVLDTKLEAAKRVRAIPRCASKKQELAP